MSDLKAFESWLRDSFPEDRVFVDEPMSRHTTFRAGGPAALMVTPASIPEICTLLKRCGRMQIPWFVMGNGSNLLVSDQGYDGLIIKLGRPFSRMRVEGSKVWAETGIMMSRLSRQAAQKGLSGLAFASGIPGTLGGGLNMNAGAYGGELRQVVRGVVAVDETGALLSLSGEQLAFGYRTSALQKGGLIALVALMELEPGDRDEILAQMEALNQKRREKQPLEYGSAGSTFKRPEGYFAGKLIEDAGLKGLSVGDAQVSEKHCGFVINRGSASAAEIYQLCRMVQQRVYEKFQISLELEVKLLGKF